MFRAFMQGYLSPLFEQFLQDTEKTDIVPEK